MEPEISPFSSLTQTIDRRRKQAFLSRENRLLIFDSLRLVLALIIAAAAFTSFFSFHIVNGNSMYPAMCDGDLVLTQRNPKLTKNDVVFYACNGGLYIGRVVAKGGDAVKVDEAGILYVNGTPQTTDVAFPTYAPEQWHTPTPVPQGTVFILGDFRTNTVDSRDLGFIPLGDIQSKVFAIVRHRGI